ASSGRACGRPPGDCSRKSWMAWLLALGLAFLLGCPAPAIYREVRPGLSCERATRISHRTLVSMGFTITSLVPARIGQGGEVTGTKPMPDGSTRTGRVLI